MFVCRSPSDECQWLGDHNSLLYTVTTTTVCLCHPIDNGVCPIDEPVVAQKPLSRRVTTKYSCCLSMMIDFIAFLFVYTRLCIWLYVYRVCVRYVILATWSPAMDGRDGGSDLKSSLAREWRFAVRPALKLQRHTKKTLSGGQLGREHMFMPHIPVFRIKRTNVGNNRIKNTTFGAFHFLLDIRIWPIKTDVSP